MNLSPENILKNLLIAVSLISISAFLFVTFRRVAYPFELEWIEGGMLQHVQRLLQGKKLFVEPSTEFVSFIYPPLYYWISALFAKVTGPGFFSMRLVSLLSTLGIAYYIYKFIHEETKSYFYSILGVGFFFGVFRISGAWYDTARVDMLFHLFIVAFLYYLKNLKTAKDLILLGVLFFLAYITKQVILFTLPGILIYLGFKQISLLIKFLCGVAAGILIFTLIYNWHTDGWYVYSTITNVTKHAIEKSMIIGFWTKDLWKQIPFLILFPVVLLYLYLRKYVEIEKDDLIFYIFVIGSLIALSWLGRVHQGGYNNVLITGYIGLCLLFSVSLFHIIKFLEKKKLTDLIILCYVLIFVQFWMLRYDPRAQIPTQKDLEAGQYLVEEIRRYDGDVWVPYHPYLAVMAGKPQYLHTISIMELTGAVTNNTENEYGKEIVNEYQDMIKNKRFDTLMLDSSIMHVISDEDLAKYYTNSGALFENHPGKVMFPVTGMETRPMSNYLPND